MQTSDRLFIWERDGRICGICGAPVDVEHLEIDHTVPRMIGGHDAPDNLRASHHVCNQRRGIEDRRRYGIKPGHPGARPESRPNLFNLRMDTRTAALIAALRRHLNLTAAGVIRLALIRLPRAEGLEVPDDGD